MNAVANPTRFEDLVRNNANLRVHCACGHCGIVDAGKACRWFLVHRWDTRLVGGASRRLRCSRCGGRPDRLDMSFEPATAPDRFPGDERAWKAKIRRVRD